MLNLLSSILLDIDSINFALFVSNNKVKIDAKDKNINDIINPHKAVKR